MPVIESKEFCHEMIKALDRIKSFKIIDREQMSDGSFGKYWARIFDEFYSRHVISGQSPTGVHPVNPPYIDVLRGEYAERLNEIKAIEAERRLHMEHMAQAIKDSKIAKTKAIISIIISGLSLVVSILSLLN